MNFAADPPQSKPSRRTSCVGKVALAVVLASAFMALAQAQDWRFSFDAAGNYLAETTESAAAPGILGQPQMQIVTPGGLASFSVTVADARGLSYQWRFNGVDITAATTDALLLTNASAADEGLYSVVLSSSSGSVTSAPAALYIDSRGCGMPDSWQLAYFGNLTQNPTGDFDGDGVSNLQEFLDGTNPTNAASAYHRIMLFNDGGSVTASPDQPSYTNGQMVVLTAAGTVTAPFHGWTGDVVTRSDSISLVMTNNKSLYAHFSPIGFFWTNAAAGDWSLATGWTPNLAPGSYDSVAISTSVSTVTLNSNVDLTDFTLGSSQGGSPIFTGGGTLTIHGALLWTSGTMSGSGHTIIPPGGMVNFANTSPILLIGRTLENAGTMVWTGAGRINVGGVVTNDAGGLFVMRQANSMDFGGGSVARFDNAGTFVTAPGAGTTAFFGVGFNNYGTVQIQGGTLSLSGGGTDAGTISVPAGTALVFAGGIYTSSGTPSITGAGNLTMSGGTATLAGTVNVTGSNVFSGCSVDFTGDYTYTNGPMIISAGAANFDGASLVSPSQLTLSGGALGGAVTVTVGSAMTWTGGSMTGTGRTIIPAGVTLNIGSGNVLFIVDRTLDNLGTTVWSGDAIHMTSGVVTNEAGALFEAQGPGSISVAGGSPRFDNAGTFRKSPGTGTTAFAGVSFNNYGDAQIQNGTLELTGGGLNHGTMEVPAGAMLSLGGVAFVTTPASSITGAGNLTVDADSATLSGLVNVSGTNTFSVGTTELNGNYICTNNTLLILNGAANFDGTGPVSPSVLNLSGGVLGGAGIVTVGKTMNWTGGQMNGSGRTVIAAGATLNVAGASALSITSRILENGGTTIWTGAGGITMSGVITNRAGALFNAQGSTSLNYGGGVPRFDNAGTFRKSVGTGTTTIGGSVAFTNYGTVDIQSGILAANGGYASSSNAVLNCALGGTTAGAGYGQLQVAGPVTLNGTLTVNLANGYVPSTGDAFTVLTAGTRNGTFANFFYPSNAVTMQLTNTPSSVVVRVTAVAAAPSPPLLLPPLLSGTNVLFTWTAVSNLTYRLEFNPDLTSSNWTAVPGDVLALTNTAGKQDTVTTSNRFYRVRVLP